MLTGAISVLNELIAHNRLGCLTQNAALLAPLAAKQHGAKSQAK